ncbi:hypothetical protein ACQKLX_16245 [Bosea sp. NPDC003192]|uniref:hypothetical protein n=1 Tax=Bosea sp. NPDC003192 TaxID=3390551 RepID=UPI003CFE3C8C
MAASKRSPPGAFTLCSKRPAFSGGVRHRLALVFRECAGAVEAAPGLPDLQDLHAAELARSISGAGRRRFTIKTVRTPQVPAPEIDGLLAAAKTTAYCPMKKLPLRHHAEICSVTPLMSRQSPAGHSSFIAYDIDNMITLKNISVIHLDDAVSRVRCFVFPDV